MTLQACADIVAKGDPDRFLAAMAAPIEARRVLFPLYAFNVEVARAPWVTQEPMIAEMRLQWWRDALEEIGARRPVRKHEVTTPLSGVLDPEATEILDKLVTARRWDIYKDAFEDAGHFDDYLSNTGGALMWVAARALGAKPEMANPVRSFGTASALVRFLQAVPELESRGRIPLVDGRSAAIAELARTHLEKIGDIRNLRRRMSGPTRAALIEGWQTVPLLTQIISNPQRVADGIVAISPFIARLRLLRWA